MVGKIMTLKYKGNTSRADFRITVLDGKLDSITVIHVDQNWKSDYQRWDIKASFFEELLYYAAKQNPNEFKLVYDELKKSDPKFFEVAKKVLKKIKAEYNFG